ncbi:NADH dehydrogenase [ubiquinone] 1 beta subcomplex subunit 6-like [Sinocyclocheilus anshuiensis]|uniref:NADH dehydrogenase [ubiquinone] 1 beta subcomplex subunit 6-like n=1 Tax=Sinocyclocheilus anshuiensis TaxID=1608454 RepID=UPI0007B897B6|nr:PREDICTED: NADH dehydrogenase [ubiquinone] 1 beta subcomplex subunit 6-like [Sinocyclocheilus anshuiensis]
MTGYSADEKLRFEQLTKLRRQWLKDQELSPREPTVAPKTPGRIDLSYLLFMRMNQTFKAYNASVFAVTRILIPAWIVHYYVKYHVSKMPYGIVALKPRLFPGDTILETGEVVPDLPEADSHGHH